VERKRTLDVIRVTAVLCVILLHASARFLAVFPVRSAAFAVGNFFDSLSRIGVPLFLMVSGALLLDEERQIPAGKMIHKILQLVGLLATWSFLYAAFHQILVPVYQRKNVAWDAFFQAFAEGEQHMWYLFMLLGLYLIVPVLRLFVKKAHSNQIRYLLVLLFVFSCVPLFVDFVAQDILHTESGITTYANKFMMAISGPNLLYFLLGWYLVHVPISKHARQWIIAGGVVGVLAVMILVWFLTTETFRPYTVLYDHGEPLMVFWSAAVFLLLQKVCRNGTSPQWLSRLSQMTFGVYACHLAVLYVVEILTMGLEKPCLELFLNFIICTVVSFGAVWLISKIPVLKKLVRM